MRRRSSFTVGASILVAFVLLPSCETLEQQSQGKSESADSALFQASVKPLLEQRCVWCHSTESPQGGLNFQDRSGLLNSKRKFIVPGHPDKSLLYQAVTLDSAHPKIMPGDGWSISQEQKSSLNRWIESGAAWPEGRTGRIKRKPYRVELNDL